MHVEFLVEGQSDEAALQALVPRILGPEVRFRTHAFHSKRNLLGQLPARLRGYAKWLPADGRIVVLVDEDRQDCHALKSGMEAAAAAAGLLTQSSPRPQAFTVLNRIVIEELEAWFLGDPEALAAAYPGVPPSLARRAKYRDPDAVRGGTWEQLEGVLQRAGYYPAGLGKIEAARRIAAHMDPTRNTSPSFGAFVSGLLSL
jgi:hypothetical protein